MVRQIGFGEFEKAWEGPVYLEFSRYHDQTKTIHYRSQLTTRTFDLYVPLFMLKPYAGDRPPDKLLAAIGKGPERLNTIGFTAAPYQPRVDTDVCEYTIADEKVNSIRYDMTFDGEVYALYVPRQIFGQEPPPPLVYLRLGVPAA